MAFPFRWIPRTLGRCLGSRSSGFSTTHWRMVSDTTARTTAIIGDISLTSHQDPGRSLIFGELGSCDEAGAGGRGAQRRRLNQEAGGRAWRGRRWVGVYVCVECGRGSSEVWWGSKACWRFRGSFYTRGDGGCWFVQMDPRGHESVKNNVTVNGPWQTSVKATGHKNTERHTASR